MMKNWIKINAFMNTHVKPKRWLFHRHPLSPSLWLRVNVAHRAFGCVWTSTSTPSSLSLRLRVIVIESLHHHRAFGSSGHRHRIPPSSPSLRLRVIVVESLDLTSLRLRVIVIVFTSRHHRAFGCVWMSTPSSSNPSTSRAFGYVWSSSSSQVDLTSLRLRVIVIVFSSGHRRRIPQPHEPSAACGPYRAFGSSGHRHRIPRPHEPSATCDRHRIPRAFGSSGERHLQHRGRLSFWKMAQDQNARLKIMKTKSKDCGDDLEKETPRPPLSPLLLFAGKMVRRVKLVCVVSAAISHLLTLFYPRHFSWSFALFTFFFLRHTHTCHLVYIYIFK